MKYPDIRYNISSGNAEHVLEYLDKGLIDFGLLFTEIDTQKYEAIPLPVKDTWGILMRKDAPLAEKETISPEDLWDKPLIVSQQRGDSAYLDQWFGRKEPELNIVATYNLVFNASLLVDEGLGYALCYDKLINTTGSNLCFRPLSEYSGPKWTIVRSESTAIKCLIGACHYLSILNNVKPASHHKVALDLTLLRILSKVDKPINAGIHVRNVGTQFSGITVL